MGSLLTTCGGKEDAKEDASQMEDPQKMKHDCKRNYDFNVKSNRDTTFSLTMDMWDERRELLKDGRHCLELNKNNMTCLALAILENYKDGVVGSMGECWGNTVHCAVNYDRITVKHYLNDKLIEGDNQIGWTPLMLACRWSDPESGTLVVSMIASHPEIQLDKRNGKGETALFWAVRRPALACKETEITTRNCNRREEGDYGTTLSWDVRRQIVQMLIDAGADICLRDSKGYSCFYRAVEAGDMEISKELHEKGANINTHSAEQYTPLWKAVQQGNLEMVRFLVENGANLNYGKCGVNSPLHEAEKEIINDEEKKKIYEEILGMLKAFVAAPKYDEAVKTEIVKLMIEQGDHKMAKSMDNIWWNDEECCGMASTLEIITEKMNNSEERKQIYKEIISLLKAAGTDSKYDEAVKTCGCTIWKEYESQVTCNRNQVLKVKLKNVSCLANAVLKNDIKSVETSLSKGCDVNFDKTEICIDKGKNFSHELEYHPGWTPLMLACKHSSLPIVSLLVKQPGIEIDKMNTKEEVALSWAARRDDNLDMVKLLVEAGADPDIRDCNGFSHLHQAASNGQWEIVKYLQSKGAYVNTQDNGLDKFSGSKFTTPMWMAAEKGNLAMVKYFVSQGAFLETPATKDNLWDCLNCDHLHPLNIAVRNGHVEIVKFLIQEGADVNLYGRKSNLEIAQSSNLNDSRNEEIINILKEEGAKDGVPPKMRYMLVDGSKCNLADLLLEIGRAMPKA